MLRDRSGMALVLTLVAVSFLVAVTVQLGSSVNVQMQAAANQGTSIRLDALLWSGLQLVRTALWADQENNDFDCRFDDWGEFDSKVLAALFPDGDLDIQVRDLSGLLQVNALVLTSEEKKRRMNEQAAAKAKGGKKQRDAQKIQRSFWKRFLLSGKFAVDNEEAADGLLDSLVDWLDEDDDEHEHGAEKGFYSSRQPPYIPPNRAMYFLDELQLVRGWNGNLLHGDEEHQGILAYLSASGNDGRININTAPAPVLQALHSEMTESLTSDLIEFRSDRENKGMLAQADWYKQVSGFPGDITFDAELITTVSSFFEVTITAHDNALQRTGTGILQRMANREQTLLYWNIE